jgi:hypothetical protein
VLLQRAYYCSPVVFAGILLKQFWAEASDLIDAFELYFQARRNMKY